MMTKNVDDKECSERGGTSTSEHLPLHPALLKAGKLYTRITSKNGVDFVSNWRVSKSSLFG